jgi:hypothetical protein
MESYSKFRPTHPALGKLFRPNQQNNSTAAWQANSAPTKTLDLLATGNITDLTIISFGI